MLAVHIYLMEGQGMKEFFGFHKMISAIIIKVLYVIGAIVLTIGGIIAPFLDGDYVLPGIAALILGNLIWRIICEGWILVFSMHETLNVIEKNTQPT